MKIGDVVEIVGGSFDKRVGRFVGYTDGGLKVDLGGSLWAFPPECVTSAGYSESVVGLKLSHQALSDCLWALTRVLETCPGDEELLGRLRDQKDKLSILLSGGVAEDAYVLRKNT